ncbi:hypothetical protein DAKH74_045940 [Maudiozyma humilis]|uniref:Uncharacterized protein n=1 Tax=Maudiozyma humilis TaxID=51915 RepID=A0AAV5S2N1_MAUHU|nr:hypothetical protein DAKH74_045940 [Kazachstania humilis]
MRVQPTLPDPVSYRDKNGYSYRYYKLQHTTGDRYNIGYHSHRYGLQVQFTDITKNLGLKIGETTVHKTELEYNLDTGSVLY